MKASRLLLNHFLQWSTLNPQKCFHLLNLLIIMRSCVYSDSVQATQAAVVPVVLVRLGVPSVLVAGGEVQVVHDKPLQKVREGRDIKPGSIDLLFLSGWSRSVGVRGWRFPRPNRHRRHESHVQDGHGQLPPGQIIHFTCRKSIMCLDSFLRLHLRKALNLKKLFYNFLSPVPATS